MSLLKKFKRANFKANSILESVISISIIALCILVGTLTYVKVFETGNTVALHKAKHKISKMLLNTSDNTFFKNQEYDFGAYRIEKKVELVPNHPLIKKVVFIVTTGHKSTKHSYILNYHFE